MASSFLSALPSMDDTFGSYLLGTFFGLILYGFCVHQAHRYTQLFPSDTIFIRCLVAAVMVAQTLHVAMTMHTCYYYLVSSFLDFDALVRGVWSLNTVPVVVGFNMLVSQLFFARRVFLMGRPYQVIVVLAMLFFAVEIGFSIAALVSIIRITTFFQLDLVNHFLTATFAAGSIGDSLLAGSLIVVVYQSRRVDPSRTDTVVDKVMIYGVNTGVLHDILNIISLAVVVAYPNYLIHGSISIVTTRVYAITLLAVLNSRKFLYNRGIEIFDGDGAVGMANIIARANRLATHERWNVPQTPNEVPDVINIHVTTESLGRKEGACAKAHLMKSGSPFGLESYVHRERVEDKV